MKKIIFIMIPAACLSLIIFFSCNKSKNRLNPVAHHNSLLSTHKEGDHYDLVGDFHNEALGSMLAEGKPDSITLEDLLTFAKFHVSKLTNDPDALQIINNFSTDDIRKSWPLYDALLNGDKEGAEEYLSPIESALMIQLVISAQGTDNIHEEISKIETWENEVRNNQDLSEGSREKLLYASAIFTKSAAFWDAYNGGSPPPNLHWVLADVCGGIIGFGFGQFWGAVIGAVVCSIFHDYIELVV